MKDKNHQEIDRREFLKIVGITTVAATTALYGCTPGRNHREGATTAGNVPEGGMTYRVHPRTGDRVSILGYGCMRWAHCAFARRPGRPDRPGSSESAGGLCY